MIRSVLRDILLVTGILIAPYALAGRPPEVQNAPATRLSTSRALSVPRTLEARKRYRACLFAYLPRVGSDVAAELLRRACAEEYLPHEERGRDQAPADRSRRGRSGSP